MPSAHRRSGVALRNAIPLTSYFANVQSASQQHLSLDRALSFLTTRIRWRIDLEWRWGRNSLLWRWCSTGTGCPEMLWMPIIGSVQPQVGWGFEQPHLVGLDDHESSLQAQTILWFSGSMKKRRLLQEGKGKITGFNAGVHSSQTQLHSKPLKRIGTYKFGPMYKLGKINQTVSFHFH